MKRLLLLGVLAMTALVTGCTDYRTIPVSKVGLVIDNKGSTGELYYPGTYDIGWALKYTKTLALLDTSVETPTSTLTIRTSDDQELTVTVKAKVRAKTNNEEILKALLGMVTPDKTGEAYTLNLPMSKIYDKLGRDIVERSMVEIISPTTLEDFRDNRQNINDTLEQQIDKRFQKLPISLLGATITRVDYPPSYIDQANKVKAEQMSIELKKNQEEAKRAKLAQEELSVQIERRVRLAQAETLRQENEKTAAGLNPMLLEYRKLALEERRLEVDAMFAEAAKTNGNSTIFYPSHQRPDYVDVALSKK